MGSPLSVDVHHIVSIDPATRAFLTDLADRPAGPAFDFAAAFAALEKTMSQKIDDLDASIQQLNTDVDEALAAQATFTDKINALNTANTTLKDANAVLQSGLDADEAELDKAKQAIAAASARIDQLTAALAGTATPAPVTTTPETGTTPEPGVTVGP
jgi:septal ring factor EnvC (AmiA/AmiB activator)